MFSRLKTNSIKITLQRPIQLRIAHCALPIELQGKRLGKNLPAKQLAIGN